MNAFKGEYVGGVQYRKLGGFMSNKNPSGSDEDFERIYYFAQCERCEAIILAGSMQMSAHSKWHADQTTVAHGTAMLQGQDRELELLRQQIKDLTATNLRLQDELESATETIQRMEKTDKDRDFLLMRMESICALAQKADSQMPAGFMPGQGLVMLLRKVMNDMPSNQRAGTT